LLKNFTLIEVNKVLILKRTLNVGANIYCVKKCPFNQNLFATGGKENDLKLWDLEKDGNENIFKAKNVRTGV